MRTVLLDPQNTLDSKPYEADAKAATFNKAIIKVVMI
jgi:hypothetical protein